MEPPYLIINRQIIHLPHIQPGRFLVPTGGGHGQLDADRLKITARAAIIHRIPHIRRPAEKPIIPSSPLYHVPKPSVLQHNYAIPEPVEMLTLRLELICADPLQVMLVRQTTGKLQKGAESISIKKALPLLPVYEQIRKSV